MFDWCIALPLGREALSERAFHGLNTHVPASGVVKLACGTPSLEEPMPEPAQVH